MEGCLFVGGAAPAKTTMYNMYMRSQTLVGCLGKRGSTHYDREIRKLDCWREPAENPPRLPESFAIKPTFFHTAVKLTASNCIQPLPRHLQNASVSNIPQSNVHSVLQRQHLDKAGDCMRLGEHLGMSILGEHRIAMLAPDGSVSLNTE